MIDDTRSRPPSPVVLSPSDLAEATRELHALRAEHRADLDDGVTELRIVHLERLIASATIVDGVAGADGIAGLGSFVRVRDGAGRRCDYELVGRRGTDATTMKVTLGSPVGAALVGARTGDTVQVELPDGRRRPLTVLAIQCEPFTD